MDREKVIKGLHDIGGFVAGRIGIGQARNFLRTIDDAIEILKEQEAVEPTSYMDGLVQRFTCGKCGKHLLYAKWGRDNFCSKCGQAVKWND